LPKKANKKGISLIILQKKHHKIQQ